MNYKSLISERIKNEKYLLILTLFFIVTIFVGLLIVHKMRFRSFIVLLSVCIFLVLMNLYYKRKLKKIYEKLSEEEQKNLDSDINQTFFFSGKDYALSSQYIINFKNPKIIKYSSILIIDKTTGLSSHGRRNLMCDIVYVFTKNEKVGLILKEYGIIKLYPQYYEGLYSYIKAQNPNVLEGYTKENRKIIKDKYNIEI